MKKTCIISFAVFLMIAGRATASTTTYEFLPDQSNVIYQNWSWGYICETFPIAGSFRLTVDFDAHTASFDQVDANLSETISFCDYHDQDLVITDNLDTLFHMTELVSTGVNDVAIDFIFEKNIPAFPSADVCLRVTFLDGSVHLTGSFSEACYDCGQFDIDALASKKAAVYYVDNDGPADFNNIQAAIDNASDGDTIIVSDGTYTGDGNRDIDFLGKAITVRSENGLANCIIDCNGTESDPHRGFYFHSGEDAESVVEGLTITNAGDETFYGGAIYCRQSSPMITKCTINASIAAAGGGIYCYESNPTISNCTITGNTGGPRGSGGISCHASNPTISNCIINGNVASIGGGIFCKDASNPLIINCTISGNTTSGNGGGIYCLDTSSPTIANCILWGNMASEGNQIAVGHPYYSGENILTVNYSNVQGGQDDVYIKPGCILNWGGGNIDVDPCFVDPNNSDYHLKSEGWRWDIKRNRWTYDDVTSRCIDAGNPGSPLGDELLSIPDDPNNIWGQNLRINMGAYGGTAEASMPPYDWAILGDLTNDGLVNLEDYAFQAADWLHSADQQPGDLNRDNLIDISDLVLLVEDWLRQTSWAG